MYGFRITPCSFRPPDAMPPGRLLQTRIFPGATKPQTKSFSSSSSKISDYEDENLPGLSEFFG
jgi:hypothetical protein